MNNNPNNNDFNNMNNNENMNNNNQFNNMNQYPNNNNDYYNNMNNGYNNPYNNGYNNMNNGYYNDYNNMPYYKKPLSHYIKRFLIGFLCAALFIFILLWLFPTKSGLNDSLSDALNPFYDRIFQENLNTMKEVAIAYYTTDRLPQKEGDTKKLTLGEMLEMKLLLEIKDKNGEMCDTDDSYVEITRLEDEYKMKVNLKCGDEEDYIVVYLGCYDYCLNDICEKQESTKQTVAAAGSSGGGSKVSNFFKKITTTINKTVDKVTEIIVPDKPDPKPDPDPDDPVYKYLYRKTVTVHHDAEYSKWSDWSANIEYDPNNNNIDWGKHDTVWYEKVGYKITPYYEYEVDYDQPIYTEKYDRLLGYKKQYACSGYTYYIDSVTSTTYQVSGWTKTGRVTLSYKPTQSNTKRYVYVGMNYDLCADTCTLKPYYIFDVYERSAKAVSTSYTDVKATCNNVVTKQIPIYGKRVEVSGYVTNRILKEKKTYYYHKKTRDIIQKAYDETKTYELWSYSKNDQTLIDQGYKYTGIYKKVK